MKNRRSFIKNASLIGTGIVTSPLLMAQSQDENAEGLYQIGPREGYSTHVGAMLSMMEMMRHWVIGSVEDLSQAQLDFQLDEDSNSIGAMLLHLAATERYYQLNTFDGIEWGEWDKSIANEWDLGMDLGEKGRKEILGHDVEYYIAKLNAVRAQTKKGFAERDDKWFFESEPFFGDLPTNNYAKWFHVCEHESNHRGQIKLIKKRFPENLK